MIKLIKTEGTVVAKGWERRGNGELLFNGCRVLVTRDEFVRDFLYNSVYSVNNMIMDTSKLFREIYKMWFLYNKKANMV